MSSLKTGWIIAAATAAAFAVGCAGQGHADLGASCAGEPAMPAKHGCKGVAECKAKVVKHHHHAKVAKQEKVKDEDTTTTTTTKEETDSKTESK